MYKCIIMLAVFPRVLQAVWIDSNRHLRRTSSIWMNILIGISYFSIVFGLIDSALALTLACLAIAVLHQMIDAIMAAYILELARGVPYGIEDMTSFKLAFFGVSATFGALWGTYYMAHGEPRMCFGLMGLCYILAGLQSILLPKSLDAEETEVEGQNPDVAVEQLQKSKKQKLSYCQEVCSKFKIIKTGLQEPTMRRFICFLGLTALTMP